MELFVVKIPDKEEAEKAIREYRSAGPEVMVTAWHGVPQNILDAIGVTPGTVLNVFDWLTGKSKAYPLKLQKS
jgi:hypothetical protein